MAAAVTTAALAVAPLAGAGTAFAEDDPYPSHSTTGHPYPPKPHHPYPPKPPKPHHPDKPDHWDHPDKPEHGGHLADTGDDNTEIILGGVAAALVAAGVGTVLVVRRRRHS
ncbi:MULTISPECIES: LAETG motif-containing sortase-dependent surface protein [unclassified Streptomyces]|uniref:LAETG motif-containing sortase-dependent surface protein n=1 Tax=unclassified Streptomyces TaxID=2593676 RepID=UPI00364053C5